MHWHLLQLLTAVNALIWLRNLGVARRKRREAPTPARRKDAALDAMLSAVVFGFFVAAGVLIALMAPFWMGLALGGLVFVCAAVIECVRRNVYAGDPWDSVPDRWRARGTTVT